VRTVFTLYVVMIVAGLALWTTIGLVHH